MRGFLSDRFEFYILQSMGLIEGFLNFECEQFINNHLQLKFIVANITNQPQSSTL